MEGGFRDLAVRSIRVAADWAAGALFPHFCAGCGQEGGAVCGDCDAAIKAPRAGFFVCPACEIPTPFGARCDGANCATRTDSAAELDGLFCATSYDDAALQRLLHEYKYGRCHDAGVALASAFAATVESHLPALLCIARDAVIVPIPLAPIKQATRGFNQAEIFGQELARLTGRPAVPRVLCRARGGPAQATLEDAVARRANARGKFAVRVPFGAGRRFVVVDDVATTRATLGDAARALKEAGAGEVWGVTVLRG